jgi:hypothetical protein
MSLRPNEIEEIIKIYLRRRTDGQSIQSSAELREKLQIAHSFYCRGITAARVQPKTSKRKTKSQLGIGAFKIVAGTGMFVANCFSYLKDTPSSISSCLSGIDTFVDGFNTLKGKP